MEKIYTVIKFIFASAGSMIGAFLGGLDGFLIALTIFVITDYITGIAVAIVKKELSSAVGFKGIAKKVLIFALVGIGNLIDVYILTNGHTVRTAVIFFYIANEGISIVENSARLGLPIPEKLKQIFSLLHKESEKKASTQKDKTEKE